MANDPQEIASLLRQLYISQSLTDAEVAKLASLATVVSLDKDGSVRSEGDVAAPFFLILKGKISLQPLAKGRSWSQPTELKTGQFFGADYLLYGKVRSFDATALTQTDLLCLDTDSLKTLLLEIPRIRDGLAYTIQVNQLLQSRHFSWVGDDELVQVVALKHPAYLMISLILPVLIGWIAVIFFVFGALMPVASFRLALEWMGILVGVIAFLFGLWRYVDWRNDYYIVTDQRVVWLEQVIGLYDSRNETPLSAIKSTEVRSSQIGRIMNFGDLIINAFMGQVIFDNVAQPKEIKAWIDRLQKLAAQRVVKSDKDAMEGVIRDKINPPPASQTPTVAAIPASNVKNPKPKEPLFISLGKLLKTRIEDSDTITYRKHVFILLTKTWAPLLVELFLVVATFLLFRARSAQVITFPSTTVIILLALFIMFLVSMWGLYHFVDWINDIYQVSSEKIVDSERRPLGDEVTKSALLANVLSMDYERLGILGVLLNFGDVIINVGAESKFIFHNIHDPARAQQDIFNRMYSVQRKKQQSDMLKQGEQMVDWIAAYHRQTEALRKPEDKS